MENFDLRSLIEEARSKRTIKDELYRLMREHARRNNGKLPSFILIHPLSFEELMEDLCRSKLFFVVNPYELKFMGAELIRTEKVEVGQFKFTI
jgi:hypothetical protein